MKPPLAAIFLLSAATLAYEVLLTRLFALILWHHYAQMIISLALLGFALSGTVLAACGPRLAEPRLCRCHARPQWPGRVDHAAAFADPLGTGPDL